MANIIVVDDDNDVIDVIKMYLEGSEHQVVYFDNAEECLDWVATKPVDLLITDLLMPEKSGLELISEVQKEHPEISVMAISGGGETGGIVKAIALDKAIDLGAKRALAKPFTKEELILRIDKLLK